jgi:hypothetical protein
MAAIPNKVGMAIHLNYHNNWIVDDYPMTTRYSQGFHIGFITNDAGKAYIHNQSHSCSSSTKVVKFTTLLILVLFWFGMATPLVFLRCQLWLQVWSFCVPTRSCGR